MNSITITTDGAGCTLDAPYDPALPKLARALGGRWDGPERVWRFDARDEAAVRQLAVEIYGTDGTVDADQPGVTVRVAVRQHVWADELRLAGRVIARRNARDGQVRFGEGTVLVASGFEPRGGSVRDPQLAPLSGTVLEVRDVPAGQATRMVAQGAGAVTILSAHSETVERLQARRAELLRELGQVEAELAALSGPERPSDPMVGAS